MAWMGEGLPASTPAVRRRTRNSNGAAWRKARARVMASEDTCALCGRPVDKSLPALHPFSAQVDHIIPVARGGPLTARSNLQLTHRVCNRRKGTGDDPSPPATTSRAW